ncbi:MAG: MBL fold metallo-hydrolase [Desulfovibrionaceae bacterium]
MGQVKIHILTDNTAQPGFEAEHGLSMAVELPSGALWLWDTGASGMFARNAQKMAVPVAAAKGLALSHGHYDHTGGLKTLFEDVGFAGPVYAHPDHALPRFVSKPGEPVKAIGLDTVGMSAPLPGFVPVEGSVALDEGLTFFAPVPRKPGAFESVHGFFFDAACTRPDTIADDGFLTVATDKGVVVILGCCHSGLGNTLRLAAEELGVDRFHAVVGGLHLKHEQATAFTRTLGAMEKYHVAACCPGHCTGDPALQFLTALFGGTVTPLASGLTLTF